MAIDANLRPSRLNIKYSRVEERRQKLYLHANIFFLFHHSFVLCCVAKNLTTVLFLGYLRAFLQNILLEILQKG